MMKKTILRVMTVLVALAMILGCFSGCASITTKLSVNNVELDGDYLTPDDYIAEIEANAPEYSDDEFETEDEPATDDEGEGEDEPATDDEGEGEDKPATDDEGEGEDEPATDDEGEGEEEDEPTGEKDYSDYITVASYNIKCAWYGKSWENVINTIKSVDPAIIGLQECDNGTNRSAATPGNYPNQVQQLAHDMGYDYWYFSKTIFTAGRIDGLGEIPIIVSHDMGYDYWYFSKTIDTSGGEYGHGVMSKYPIKDSQTIFFKSQKDETRNMERHVLDVDGTELIFYNTHLNGSFFDQFNEVVAAIEKDYAAGKYVMLTGDFNIKYPAMSGWLDTDTFLPLNGDDSFSFGVEKHTAIDNIILSRNIKDYYFDESLGYGIRVIPDPDQLSSDHPMVYSHIKLPE